MPTHADSNIRLSHPQREVRLMLDLFRRVHAEVQPSSHISLLQSLTHPPNAFVAHSFLVQSGFRITISLSTTLVDVYSKFGLLRDARAVFDYMPQRNVVSWTAMIAGYARHEDIAEEGLLLFGQMLSCCCVPPTEFTLVAVVNACANRGSIEDGRMLHSHMLKKELDIDIFTGNALVNMYAKCGNMSDAFQVFHDMKDRDVVTWTALITGCVKRGLTDEALQLFQRLDCEGLEPNEITYVSILGSIIESSNLNCGRLIHTRLLNCRISFNVPLHNALIDMYCKCGNTKDGRQVFDNMDTRNTISWNAIIAGYAKDKCVQEVLKLYQDMANFVNHVTFVIMINLFATIKDLECGKIIHFNIVESGGEIDTSLGNSLIDFYINCQRLEDARVVFCKMVTKDVVSWSTLLVGYCNSEHTQEAMRLFYKMEQEGVNPNATTCLTIVTACSSIGALEQSMLIHAEVVKTGNESEIFLENALIDMYIKCGNVFAAYDMFNRLPQPDIVSWNTVINGLAVYGYGRDSLLHFERMKEDHVDPSAITYLGIISACSHAGMVDEGCSMFNLMIRDLTLVPTTEHFACMVDMLARAGCLEGARELVKGMPVVVTCLIWRALLSSCRFHGCICLAANISGTMMDFEHDASSFLLIKSLFDEDSRGW